MLAKRIPSSAYNPLGQAHCPFLFSLLTFLNLLGLCLIATTSRKLSLMLGKVRSLLLMPHTPYFLYPAWTVQ
jgi:hypothetical protein